MGTLGSRARLGHIRHARDHGHPVGAGTSVHALSGWIKRCVRTELGAHRAKAHGTTQTMVTEVHAHSGCVAHGAEHLGGDDQGGYRVERAPAHRELPGQTGGNVVSPVHDGSERSIRATRTGVGHLVRVGEGRGAPILLGGLRLSAGGDSSGAGAGRARARPAREPPRDGPTTLAVIVRKEGGRTRDRE